MQEQAQQLTPQKQPTVPPVLDQTGDDTPLKQSTIDKLKAAGVLDRFTKGLKGAAFIEVGRQFLDAPLDTVGELAKEAGLETAARIAGLGTAPAAAAEAPAAPAGLTEAMRAAASEEHLVPSPGEMQAAMSSAGIQTTLASLVSTREMDMSNPNKDHIAVRTGVVLADLLLTVSDADKADTVSRFKQIREGLSVLKAGEDLPREIDDLIERIEADSLTGDKLVKHVLKIRINRLNSTFCRPNNQICPIVSRAQP